MMPLSRQPGTAAIAMKPVNHLARRADRKLNSASLTSCGPLLLTYLLMSFFVSPATSQGGIVSWGNQVFPRVPRGTVFTNITTGFYHTLAIKSDGTIMA